MSDEPEHDDGGTQPQKPERKKRSDAGKPRGSGRKHVSTRFERRATKAEETIRELIKLGRPDLDVEGLSFVEVVDRDVAAWGRFIAQLGEWLLPFGSFVDLFFGSPLVVVLNMAPSVRAARRDLKELRERRAVERQAAAEEQALRESIERDHEEAAGAGVFGPARAPDPADGYE